MLFSIVLLASAVPYVVNGHCQSFQDKPGGTLLALVSEKCPMFDCSKVDLDNLECSLTKPSQGKFSFELTNPRLRGGFPETESDGQSVQQLLACICCAKIGSELEEDNNYDISVNSDELALVGVGGNVTYNVYAVGDGSCPPTPNGWETNLSTLMEPQTQEIGHCQNHGKGKNAYNSIQVLGCTDRCLCFKQVAANTEDADCDEDKALGWNIKMTCFDQCLLDCNGKDCGKTAVAADPPHTRLMLTGSGPIIWIWANLRFSCVGGRIRLRYDWHDS